MLRALKISTINDRKFIERIAEHWEGGAEGSKPSAGEAITRGRLMALARLCATGLPKGAALYDTLALLREGTVSSAACARHCARHLGSATTTRKSAAWR